MTGQLGELLGERLRGKGVEAREVVGREWRLGRWWEGEGGRIVEGSGGEERVGG